MSGEKRVTITIGCMMCYNRACIDPDKMTPWLGMIPDLEKPETFSYPDCEECNGTGEITKTDQILWEAPLLSKNRPYK